MPGYEPGHEPVIDGGGLGEALNTIQSQKRKSPDDEEQVQSHVVGSSDDNAGPDSTNEPENRDNITESPDYKRLKKDKHEASADATPMSADAFATVLRPQGGLKQPSSDEHPDQIDGPSHGTSNADTDALDHSATNATKHDLGQRTAASLNHVVYAAHSDISIANDPWAQQGGKQQLPNQWISQRVELGLSWESIPEKQRLDPGGPSASTRTGGSVGGLESVDHCGPKMVDDIYGVGAFCNDPAAMRYMG